MNEVFNIVLSESKTKQDMNCFQIIPMLIIENFSKNITQIKGSIL